MEVYKGFTNIVLDESSFFLTTMQTPIGRYRWLRMQFGLVFGSGETIEEAERDHDINLWNLMLRCQEVNLKLNPKKCQFKVEQVTWMGHIPE